MERHFSVFLVMHMRNLYKTCYISLTQADSGHIQTNFFFSLISLAEHPKGLNSANKT